MKKKIPAPLISVLSDGLSDLETHAGLDSLFHYADAPGEPPEGSKSKKTMAWLRRINKESEFPLKILGRLVEGYIELSDENEKTTDWLGNETPNYRLEFKKKLLMTLERCNLSYISGGIISDGGSAPSRSLEEIIKIKDIPTAEAEFNRALNNVSSNPREAVSAACNILESIFKVYIEDEGLFMPQKQDLSGVWRVVKDDLGFNPGSLEDNDLKKILSGIISVVDGIGSFRTHASSAHGSGRRTYNLQARHARLAINSAHTLALFVLETWDERKKR